MTGPVVPRARAAKPVSAFIDLRCASWTPGRRLLRCGSGHQPKTDGKKKKKKKKKKKSKKRYAEKERFWLRKGGLLSFKMVGLLNVGHSKGFH
jgi:hypothetical protein